MTDLLGVHEDHALEVLLGTVGEAMNRDVVTLEPEMRASEAALILEKHGVAGGPVVRDAALIGMLSLSDILEPSKQGHAQTTGPFLRMERTVADLAVEDAMTRDVMLAREDWPLTRAVELMDAAGVNRLPVVNEVGEPVGILARDDVIRALARRVRPRPRVQAEPHQPRIQPD